VQEFAELGKYLYEPVRSYSSGMRARLAFALSMIIEFDCFLIDEIIAVGDSRFHEKCQRELFEKRQNRSMVIVSHDANFVKSHCDRAAVLVDGKLHEFNTVDKAYDFYTGRLG
jgi:capsular polysaccharide transport system ATP-binding protein